jgi:hypothetical protein
MNKRVRTSNFYTGKVWLGGLLILLGIAFLLGEFFDIRVGRFIWPFFILGPGILLFLIALTLEGDNGQALAAVGGLVTMVGLILLYQNVTGHYTSWSYAWALIAPTSIGLGLFGYGWLKNNPDLRKRGWNVAKVGLGIFVAAAIFFEFIIGVSGLGLGGFSWPLLLIGLGLFLFIRNLTVSWRKA